MIETNECEFAAFDLETTGLDAQSDRIVEIGAVRFDVGGQELGRFERLVNPGRPMPPGAQAVHGISDRDVAGAPRIEAILPEFLGWLGDLSRVILLAHNARFDAGFVGCELERSRLPIPRAEVRDTLDLARRCLPRAPNHRLDTLAKLLDLDPNGSHGALADSLRVKGLWLKLGGASVPTVAYRITPEGATPAPPSGWDRLEVAIALGYRIRMVYLGGSRGGAPREVTPRRFLHKGGAAYLAAMCHRDGSEKEFRLDRVLEYEVIETTITVSDRAAP
jgi:DNA polymerase-3 subunit epsilon